MSRTACSRVILVMPAKAALLTNKNGTTPSFVRLKADSGRGGVAAPGKTSESARTGVLLTLTPGVSAVETGVWLRTEIMPAAEPEKLSRILTGVAPRLGTALDIVPLYVIKPVEALLVTPEGGCTS